MSCPYCGKDDFCGTKVTEREEVFDHYDENGEPVYRTVWTSYYEHKCKNCCRSWSTGCW